MTEISLVQKPQNQKVTYVTVGVLLAAFVLFFVTRTVDAYRGILQFLALLLFVTAILLYTTYVGAVLLYDIIPGANGAPIFTVRRKIGKRITTLSVFALSDIREVKTVKKREKPEKGRKTYVYSPTLFIESLTLVRLGDEAKADVYLELSPENAAILLPAFKQKTESP